MQSICKSLQKSKQEDKKQTIYTVIAISSVLLPERSAVQTQNAAALHLRHLTNYVVKISPEQLIATKQYRFISQITVPWQSTPLLLTIFRMTQYYLVEFN